jgi:hypothetical protein
MNIWLLAISFPLFLVWLWRGEFFWTQSCFPPSSLLFNFPFKFILPLACVADFNTYPLSSAIIIYLRSPESSFSPLLLYSSATSLRTGLWRIAHPKRSSILWLPPKAEMRQDQHHTHHQGEGGDIKEQPKDVGKSKMDFLWFTVSNSLRIQWSATDSK